jgi:mono/diheme cytochrome c family protein
MTGFDPKRPFDWPVIPWDYRLNQFGNHQQKNLKDSAMRTASTCFVAFWMTVCSAWGQESDKAEDLRQGHQLAVLLCAKCHLAASDQRLMPDLNPPAPSFAQIAQRKDLDADSLKIFLTTTHRGLDNPKGMPDLSLANSQVKQVVAYILSLRK